MIAPWAFLTSPLRLGLWFSNRFVTGTGAVVVWRRLRDNPNRTRRFLFWLVALNLCSVAIFVVTVRIIRC